MIQHNNDVKKLKIITQNCFYSKRIKQVCNLFKANPSDIYCLQEITGNRAAERIKSDCHLDYIISKSINLRLSVDFHNAIFTNLPLIDYGELDYSKKSRKWIAPSAGRVLWSIVKIGDKDIKIYNCHFSIKDQGMLERQGILLKIIKDADEFGGPVIICGDMNTAIPCIKKHRRIIRLWNRFPKPDKKILGSFADRNEKHLFAETAHKCGFKEITNLEENTWCIPFIKKEAFGLKLDWVLYKGFDKALYKLGPWIGDHRAIIGELIISN